MSDWGGFKLGGLTAVQLNIIMRDGPGVPILPTTRDRLASIPGRNGAYYFGADLQELRITIPCAFIFAGDRATLAQHAQTLGDHLIDATTKQPKKLTLIFEEDQTKEYEVYYSGLLDLTRTVIDGEFDLPLMAPDPFDSALVVVPEPPEPTPITADHDATEEQTLAGYVEEITWERNALTFTSDPSESQILSGFVERIQWAIGESDQADEGAILAGYVEGLAWEQIPFELIQEGATFSGYPEDITWQELDIEPEPYLAEIQGHSVTPEGITWS